jgi:hypothetical protein
MSTPSIQTLITQAQQVLNLKSTNEIRATLAAVLANANVGTPLNPNLTTQQLWDEFYEIVRQPSDDIMSIVVDQMMRMVFSPPAPGGAGADKQVIFNDGGVLAGDTKFLWDKNANRLDVDGPVVITGDLTVDTSTLKVDATNNRVGIGLASGMTAPLEVQSNTSGTAINIRGRADNSGALRFFANDGTTQQAYISGDDSNIDIVSASTRPIRFIVNGAVVASALNGGNVSIANGNLVMSTSGKGIDFSATPGTGTSELLADYEEGTWTGTLTGGTTNPTVPVTATGKYTKIGRQVTVVIYFQNVSTVGASGVVGITGLPFTEDGERAVGTVALHTFDFDSGTSVYADVSGSTLFFSSQLTNAAWRDVKHNAGTGRFLRTTVTYNV